MNQKHITLPLLAGIFLLSIVLSAAVRPATIAAPPAGYEIFLASPANFTFRCGCGLGEVTDATLSAEGAMTVHYFYPCGGRKLYGRLMGDYHTGENQFTGTYNTENKMYYGPISFSFNEAGEGLGEWGNGTGTLRMMRRE